MAQNIDTQTPASINGGMGQFQVGDLVTAQPWQAGKRLPARRALVVGEALGMPLLWFYTWGEPETGRSIQPIRADQLTKIGDLYGASVRQLRTWERTAVAQMRDYTGAGRALAPIAQAASRLRLRLEHAARQAG